MGMLCAVSFNRYGRLYYLDPGNLSPKVGDRVLVPTDDGPEVAECVWAAQWVDEDTAGFPRLAGMAGEEDLRRDELRRRRKAEAKVAAKRLIRAHELPMKVVAVDHVTEAGGAGGPRTTIYFTAPHRVDFRSLVRDLGATLHCRVELRQLYISSEWRGAGAARVLIDWALAEAKARGGEELYLTVYTENWRARRFYEKYGFVEVGRFPQIGRKFDRWWDIALLEKRMDHDPGTR